MTTYGFTPEYLTKNNEPWFPVMGEIHYSRFPKEYWRESILKMKAGGVTVISSYVIWIHHEEEEGVWDFSGSSLRSSHTKFLLEFSFLRISCLGLPRKEASTAAVPSKS